MAVTVNDTTGFVVTMSAGSVSTGATGSVTKIGNVPNDEPKPSVAVHPTIVVPIG